MAEKIPIWFFAQFVCKFLSILVTNQVCRYFWSVVFWWKFKIRERMGPYREHEV